MTEPTELHETLHKLHGELQQTKPVDAKSRDLLHHLMNDIKAVLDQPGNPHPEQYHSLRGRLEATLEHVEEDHPQLTLAIGAVLDNLAAIGL